MKPGTIITILLLAAGSLAGAVYMGRYSGGPPVAAPAAPEQDDENPLPVSESGPWPKLAVDEPVHRFDVMAVGEQGSHTFVIRNEGEAALKLKLLRTTCKCTFSDMNKDEVYEVAPGSSTEVTLTWQPESAESAFAQRAEVATNDPDVRKLQLGVMGSVEELATVLPAGRWDAGMFGEDGTTTVRGRVVSALRDAFALTVEPSEGTISAEVRALGEEELAEHPAKSGYEVVLTVTQPEGQTSGEVAGKVTLQTDLDGGRSFPVDVVARIPLPIALRPLSPGVEWFKDHSAIVLRERFPADEGAEAKLHLVAEGMGGEPFRVSVDEANPRFLEAAVEPRDVDARGDGSYTLTIRVPPGQLPMTRTGAEGARLTLKTNHPKLPVFPLKLSFKSY